MTSSQTKTQEIAWEDLGRPSLKMLERESFTECWLTVLPRTDVVAAEACRELFISVADNLALHGILPIQEKIYGNNAVFDEIIKAREVCYDRRGLPFDLPVTTYLEGSPARAGSVSGIQIWGIKPKEGHQVDVTTISRNGSPAGRAVKGPGFEMVYLPSVSGTLPNGTLPRSVTEQAERMLENAEESLQACGMSFLNVARTWIYLSRILHWYGEFNRVRNNFFKSRSVGDETTHPFPASTGIQGHTGQEECIMDVLAIKAEGTSGNSVRPLLHSSRQDRAFKYGSAFSRGIALTMEGKQTLHISGTASIGPDGVTRYTDEVEAQIMETLLSIASLLEPAGAGLCDIVSSTLFCKSASYYPVFRKMARLLGVPHFPVVPLVADVCRPELLVEIESVAITGGRTAIQHTDPDFSTIVKQEGQH